MDRQIKEKLNRILDKLAEIEHERWAHWQSYLHSMAERKPDGSLLIPADLVSQWERQISTPYSNLSENEKESDREQARKCFPILAEALSK